MPCTDPVGLPAPLGSAGPGEAGEGDKPGKAGGCWPHCHWTQSLCPGKAAGDLLCPLKDRLYVTSSPPQRPRHGVDPGTDPWPPVSSVGTLAILAAFP